MRRIGKVASDMAMVIGVLALLATAGCGNVQLKGESLIAAEVSTVDALNAANRLRPDANAPQWAKVYLDENFKQWRCFVRSARKDDAWGPKLPDESTAPANGSSGSASSAPPKG